MFGAKPLATLSSGLLARKGQARPAMRSQAMAGFTGPAAVDDLGWNDMGGEGAGDKVAAVLPPVLAQREALKEEVEQPAASAPEPAPEPPVAAAVATPAPEAPVEAAEAPLEPEVVARIGREAARVGKAAFTLRLPPDRHLRLRLASAVRHRSAQAIVTEALDAFLAGLPEVEALAGQCAAPTPRGSRP